jgi:prepilin-type processing-associated H-X9-DG protein
VLVLPYLDQSPRYNAINHSQNALLSLGTSNSTCLSLRCSSLLCPADPYVVSSGWIPNGSSSYAGCIGSGANSDITDAKGVFGSMRPLTYEGITDGSSSTAAVSEFLVGVRQQTFPLRSLYKPDDYSSDGANNLSQFEARCTSLSRETPSEQSLKGKYWMLGSLAYTLYDNTLSINSPSCFNTVKSTYVHLAISASSLHPGGANVLFVDGHVKFVSQSISSSVWRAAGTRSGGEVISSEAF